MVFLGQTFAKLQGSEVFLFAKDLDEMVAVIEAGLLADQSDSICCVAKQLLGLVNPDSVQILLYGHPRESSETPSHVIFADTESLSQAVK